MKTDADLAELLGVTREWVQDQCRAKRIAHHRIGRYYKFDDSDVASILADTAVAPEITDPYAPTSRSQASRRAS